MLYRLITPTCIWIEWLVCVPLISFLTTGANSEAAASYPHWLLFIFLFLCILCGFIMTISINVTIGVIFLILACIFYLFAVIVCFYFHENALKLSSIVPSVLDLQVKQFERLQWNSAKVHIKIMLFLVMPIFPFFVFLGISNILNSEETFVSLLICNLIAKNLYISFVRDSQLNVVDAMNTTRKAAFSANRMRRDILKYVFHEIRNPLNSMFIGLDIVNVNNHTIDSSGLTHPASSSNVNRLSLNGNNNHFNNNNHSNSNLKSNINNNNHSNSNLNINNHSNSNMNVKFSAKNQNSMRNDTLETPLYIQTQSLQPQLTIQTQLQSQLQPQMQSQSQLIIKDQNNINIEKDAFQLINESMQNISDTLNDVLYMQMIDDGTLKLNYREFLLREAITNMIQSLKLKANNKNITTNIQVLPMIPYTVIGNLILTDWLTDFSSFTYSFIYSFINSFIHSFNRLFIHLFIHLLVHLFILLFIHLFIHSIIY